MLDLDLRTGRWLTMVCLIASGCSAAVDTAEWEEEVQLSDSSRIVVWRQAKANRYGFPNAQRGSDISFRLEYRPRGIVWDFRHSHDRVRSPVSFDAVDGVYYLVLSGGVDVCNGRSSEDYAAQFMKWSGTSWVELPQSDFPIERATVNLSQDYWGRESKDDYRGLVRWEDKAIDDRPSHLKPLTVKEYFELRSTLRCGAYMSTAKPTAASN